MFSVIGIHVSRYFYRLFSKTAKKAIQNYRETEYVDYLSSFIQYGAFHRQQQKHHRKSSIILA